MKWFVILKQFADMDCDNLIQLVLVPIDLTFRRKMRLSLEIEK